MKNSLIVAFVVFSIQIVALAQPTLKCISNYRVAGDEQHCGSNPAEAGPIYSSKAFDKHTITLEGVDDRFTILVTASIPNLNTLPTGAIIRITPIGQKAALTNATVSVLEKAGGGRLLVNLEEVTVNNPVEGCRYHRYLSVRCEGLGQ